MTLRHRCVLSCVLLMGCYRSSPEGCLSPEQVSWGMRILQDMQNLDISKIFQQTRTKSLKRKPVQRCAWQQGEGNWHFLRPSICEMLSQAFNRHYFNDSSNQPCEMGGITPILQMRKLRPREVKSFVLDHTALEWQSGVQTQSWLVPKLMFFPHCSLGAKIYTASLTPGMVSCMSA